VDLIIAARDHASSLAPTLAALPSRLVRSVVVVDNGSTDSTATIAHDAGAVVLRESRAGHGAACLRAIAHLENLPRPPDTVVFMAPDGSDDPRDIPALLGPIALDNAELVIGVRQGRRVRSVESRVLIGLIGAIYRHRFDDLGPFRAIRFPALVALALSESSAAFHIEMQVKAIKLGLHIAEVPVRTRLPPGRRRPNPSLQATSKAFFHILRHSTSR
jgi:glycosyltransferase involved in cell wall biosynthesis